MRYAVVGLGHIAQVAVLPAFAHARRNSRLTALVSGDQSKLRALSKRYRVDVTGSYEELEACLEQVDAVYIALPNSMHEEYTVRAAQAGVHVLCEKPMAPSSDECKAVVEACQRENVRLMIAYRLHFQSANLHVVDLIQRGTIGTPKVFSSVFSYQVKDGNTRVEDRAGAGPLYDIGIYCINAARYVFRDEPIGVHAHRIQNGDDERFKSVEEGVAVSLRYSC